MYIFFSIASRLIARFGTFQLEKILSMFNNCAAILKYSKVFIILFCKATKV